MTSDALLTLANAMKNKVMWLLWIIPIISPVDFTPDLSNFVLALGKIFCGFFGGATDACWQDLGFTNEVESGNYCFLFVLF